MTDPTSLPFSDDDASRSDTGAPSGTVECLDSDAVFRAIFERAPSPMGIVELTDGDILHVVTNAAACRLLGVSRGGANNRWASELGATPETIAAWSLRLRESAACRGSVQFECLQQIDGRREWLVITVAPLDDGPSGPRRFCYVAENVTTRKQTEERLRTIEASAQRVFDAAGFIAFTWDIPTHQMRRVHGKNAPWQATVAPETSPRVPARVHSDELERFDGAIRGACEQRNAGRESDYRLHLPHHELRWIREAGRLEFDDDGRPRRFVGSSWDAALFEVLDTGRCKDIEFSFDGEQGRRHFTCRLVPEPNKDGQIEHILGVAHDITERRQYEHRLLEGDRRKDEFLATLAHELRNPLAAIRTGLEVLARSPDGVAMARTREMMGRQIDHMVRLVDDLLDASRIGQGKLELKRTRVSLRSVLENAIEVVRPALEAARHELLVHITDEPIWVEGDATRLGQVVSNLLNNAVKYTPDGGRVEVSAERDESHAVLCVVDNGVGIAAELLPKVFELFIQGRGTLNRAQGGLGIGLALVQKLVEMHGGVVEVRSPGVGRGCSFTVRLPLCEAPASHPSERS